MDKSLSKFLDESKFKIGKTDLPTQSYISTGSLVLDFVMGRGIPFGKILEVYGAPSCGKTLIALNTAAQLTQNKRYVLYCAVENDFDTQESYKWLEAIGVDTDYFIRVPPSPAEELIDHTVEFLDKSRGQFDIGLMVVDSIGAVCSGKALNKKADEKTVAEEARLIRKWLNQLINVMGNTSIIMNNHEIAKIGSYMGGKTTKGGSAPEYFSSIRLQVKGSKVLDPRGELYGVLRQEMIVNCTKNKISTPGRVGSLIFDFETMRYDQAAELVQLGVRVGVIQKEAAMYKFSISGEDHKVKGKDNLAEMLKENEHLFQELQKLVFNS